MICYGPTRSGWLLVILGGIFAGTLSANWNDTLTGIDLDKLPHFPLTKIRSGSLKDGSQVKFDGITATAGTAAAGPFDRWVELRGNAKSGKQWEVHLFGLDEVWRGDLDGNGTQDYVFFAGGPYFNGRTTPLFSLSILLMDRDGMPTPFFTVVYHGENGDGIKHLVDLDHEGRAELLISSYDEDPSDAYVGPFCSGHWINQLYQFKNFGAEEIRGTVGGITFPLIHDWSYRGTECEKLEEPFMAVQAVAPSDLGTGLHGRVSTTLRKTEPASGLPTVEPVAGCAAIRTAVVVYDQPRIREIAFPSLFDTYSADLADRIHRDGAHVELRGINRSMGSDICSVNLMWAK
jgi:hypothetical protein